MRYLLILLTALSLNACVSPCTNCKKPPAPGDPTCETACNRFRELKCREGEPTAAGASCEQVCDNMHTSNGLPAYDLGCASVIMKCEEVNKCPMVKGSYR